MASLGGNPRSGGTMSAVDVRGSDRLLLSTRFALMAGFGGLLAIMAIAGIYGIGVLQKIRRNDTQIRRQFLSNNHALNDIRSQLYLSGTYVRDYLLEPDPGRAEIYRASLEEVHRQMESALESFGRQLESGPAPILHRAVGGALRLLADPRPDFPMGRQPAPDARDTFSSGMRSSLAARRCSRSRTASRTSTNSS